MGDSEQAAPDLALMLLAVTRLTSPRWPHWDRASVPSARQSPSPASSSPRAGRPTGAAPLPLGRLRAGRWFAQPP